MDFGIRDQSVGDFGKVLDLLLLHIWTKRPPSTMCFLKLSRNVLGIPMADLTSTSLFSYVASVSSPNSKMVSRSSLCFLSSCWFQVFNAVILPCAPSKLGNSALTTQSSIAGACAPDDDEGKQTLSKVFVQPFMLFSHLCLFVLEVSVQFAAAFLEVVLGKQRVRVLRRLPFVAKLGATLLQQNFEQRPGSILADVTGIEPAFSEDLIAA